jgi:hypothetical protein
MTPTWITLALLEFLPLILVVISPRQPIDVLLACPVQMAQQCLLTSRVMLLMPRVQPIFIRSAQIMHKLVVKYLQHNKKQSLVSFCCIGNELSHITVYRAVDFIDHLNLQPVCSDVMTKTDQNLSS